MKVTSKVHGELVAARKSKRAAKGELVPAETVEAPAAVQAEPAPTKKRTRTSKGTEEAAAEAPALKPAAASKPTTDAADDGGETCVFAFRLTRSERDAIHAAAGSAKASKFVKGLAVAAAQGDVDGVLAIVTEAKAAKRS